jgi:hypothetical protein
MKARLFTCITFLLLLSCSPQDICDESSDKGLVSRFKVSGMVPVTDTVMIDVTIYGIREGKTDSLIYNAATGSRFVLPLDPNHPVSRFVIRIDTISDTLIMNHRTEAYLKSYTCGFAARFFLEEPDYSGTLIKSITTTNPTVDEDLLLNEEHIQIYF